MSTEAEAQPRLLIDVTRTLESGLHTGIQRVVRGLYHGAQQAAIGTDITVHPVRFSGETWFDLCELPAHPLEARPDTSPVIEAQKILQPRAGDQLLLADASWYLNPWPAVDELLAQGGEVAGFVHDLLPMHRPHWFRDGVGERFTAHLTALTQRAQQLFTASAHVATQLRDSLPAQSRPVARLPFACSLQRSTGATDTRGAPAPYYLSVGTLEPRKNHRLLLDAFDALWASGQPEHLLLVGAAGWDDEQLIARIEQHREFGRRLHWLRQVDDARLSVLYSNALALLYISSDEGFGLPVLEGRALGCPVIASDIAPLREAGGNWPHYIATGEQDALLAALAGPLAVGDRGAISSWRDSGRQLLQVLFDDNQDNDSAATAAQERDSMLLEMTP